eukprot:3221392-Rhodomonas_salina.2
MRSTTGWVLPCVCRTRRSCRAQQLTPSALALLFSEQPKQLSMRYLSPNVALSGVGAAGERGGKWE